MVCCILETQGPVSAHGTVYKGTLNKANMEKGHQWAAKYRVRGGLGFRILGI